MATSGQLASFRLVDEHGDGVKGTRSGQVLCHPAGACPPVCRRVHARVAVIAPERPAADATDASGDASGDAVPVPPSAMLYLRGTRQLVRLSSCKVPPAAAASATSAAAPTAVLDVQILLSAAPLCIGVGTRLVLREGEWMAAGRVLDVAEERA